MVLAVVALWAGAAPAGAGQIEEKRSEAAALASKLEDQAQSIVALDREHRRAQADLAAADGAVAHAEADLAAATARQDEARRMLVVHAQSAYAGGGTVTFLGRLTRASVNDVAARRAYLTIATGDDREAINRLRAAREDLEARRKAVADLRKAAAARNDETAGDLAQLDKAVSAQRALLAKANGELAVLVAAEQARRDAEAARAASAREAQAAAAALAAAAATPALAAAQVTTAPPASRSGAATTAPPTSAASGGAGGAAAAPASSSSMDATFACIRQLESGNNYSAPGGGAYQFQDATWHSLGYSGKAEDAPPAVQDEAARKLQARDGWSPWTTAPLCGRV